MKNVQERVWEYAWRPSRGKLWRRIKKLVWDMWDFIAICTEPVYWDHSEDYIRGRVGSDIRFRALDRVGGRVQNRVNRPVWVRVLGHVWIDAGER